MMPVRHLEQSSDDTIKVVECGGSRISIADHSEVFIVDAMVGRARQAGDRVVYDGYVGGVYLGDTNICVDVAAPASFPMRRAISKRGLKHIDGATKDLVVLGAKGFRLNSKRLEGRAIGMSLRWEVVVLVDSKFEGAAPELLGDDTRPA